MVGGKVTSRGFLGGLYNRGDDSINFLYATQRERERLHRLCNLEFHWRVKGTATALLILPPPFVEYYSRFRISWLMQRIFIRVGKRLVKETWILTAIFKNDNFKRKRVIYERR